MKLIDEVSKKVVGKYNVDETMYKLTMYLNKKRVTGNSEQYFFAKVFDKVFEKFSIKMSSRIVIANKDKVVVSFRLKNDGKKLLHNLFEKDITMIFNEAVGEVYD